MRIGIWRRDRHTVFDLVDTDQGLVVHRAALFRELLAPLPREIISTSKKLVDIVAIDALN